MHLHSISLSAILSKMQKSQRTGLLIFGLLLAGTMLVSVWRSRTAVERLGLEAPNPKDYTRLSVGAPIVRNGKSGEKVNKDSVDKAQKRLPAGDRKPAEGKRKKSEKKRGKEQLPQNDRRWLDEL